MNLPSFLTIWTYLGPLVGAVLGFLGNYLLERRREQRASIAGIQVIECVELINAKVFDKHSLGPMSNKIQMKAQRAGPDSELIDIDKVYFARYRFRNLSETPVESLLVSSKNSPGSVSFTVTESQGDNSPEWRSQFGALLEEVTDSKTRSSSAYPIPYLNPYSSTGHEVILDVSSYLPLTDLEIVGGGKGIKFAFSKRSQ
jgi:hypothetical protein